MSEDWREAADRLAFALHDIAVNAESVLELNQGNVKAYEDVLKAVADFSRRKFNVHNNARNRELSPKEQKDQ